MSDVCVDREKIRLVCATRLSSEDFFAKAPLGRSLQFYQKFPRDQPIELRLFRENKKGLPGLYNQAIEEARSDAAVLVFIHDDVYLSDFYWTRHLMQGLETFAIVGVAGTRRRVAKQPSWMYLDADFTRESHDYLSGVVGHGNGFPDLKQLSIYGEPGQQVKILDGVLLAVRSTALQEHNLRFDPRFTFHFYDLDFCRQAEERNLAMGTWAVSIVHGSWGQIGGSEWQSEYARYLDKYGE
jgi:GT2 family glycosyltransferase